MTKYLDNEGLTHFTGKMKEYADGKAGEVDSKVTTHVDNKKNPHGVTAGQVGLGNVTNDKQIPLSEKGAVNGVATLDTKGKVPVEQMPTTKTINGASIFGSGNLQLSASLYKIVDALPTTGIDTSKIYLVPASATTAKNNKTEYIYLGDPNKAYDESKWEKLGDEQKSTTVTTPGGSITVDTALIENSPNPVAGGVVKARFDEVYGKLDKKVESSDYTTKMTTIDSKLKTLENKTIDVDAELGDTSNPVQNRAVNKAVDDLNTAIGKKANSTDLNAATDRITTLEVNKIESITPLGDADGNGVASIVKDGKTLKVTKGKFVTSLVGYVTTATMNTELSKKAEKDHTHSQYALNSTLENYALNSTLANYVTDTTLTTKLADYATRKWVGDQGFAKGTIPTKVSDLNNDSGFLTGTALNGYVNSVEVPTTELMVQEGHAVAIIRKNGSKLEFMLKPFLNTIGVEDTAKKDGNGIAEISIDPTKKYILRAKKGKFITEATLGTSINDYASKQGYLTENNLNEKLKETITIKLVSDKSASDTNLNGATITVKSGDTTVSTQTWQGTPINVKVPCDKEVTIEAATVKMYVKPKMLKYVPSPLYNREVTFTYKALKTGTFIIDKNDNLYESPTKCEEAGLSKTDMIGVLLVTNNVAIVIAPKIMSNLIWSNNGNLIEGCATFPKYLDALKDFAGAANTAAIIGADSNSYIAARLCSNYVFKNGKKGYLMSVGEAKEIAENFYWLGQKLTYINDIDAPSESDKYWTSTQMNANSAWGFSMNRTSPSEVNKTVQTNAFAIYSLYD